MCPKIEMTTSGAGVRRSCDNYRLFMSCSNAENVSFGEPEERWSVRP
jgi:hypothetical protein